MKIKSVDGGANGHLAVMDFVGSLLSAEKLMSGNRPKAGGFMPHLPDGCNAMYVIASLLQ